MTLIKERRDLGSSMKVDFTIVALDHLSRFVSLKNRIVFCFLLLHMELGVRTRGVWVNINRTGRVGLYLRSISSILFTPFYAQMGHKVSSSKHFIYLFF